MFKTTVLFYSCDLSIKACDEVDCVGELAAVRDTVKAGPTEWNNTSHNNKYCTTAVLEYESSFV